MRNWIVRIGAAFVFNILLLLVIIWVTPGVHGAWGVLWASLVFTLATLFLKPVFAQVVGAQGKKLEGRTTWLKGKTLVYLVSYVVALLIWIVTVALSGVSLHSFWAWVLPPLLVLLGWVVYDQLDDAFERKAVEVYDAARARMDRNDPPPAT